MSWIIVVAAVAALAVLVGGLNAATENKLTDWAEGCKWSIPVAASTHIYQGTAVFVNSSGYGDDDTASGVNAFFGWAVEEKDNSSGSNGDLTVECRRSGIILMTGSGFTQADVGKDAFLDDNYALVVADGASSVRVGKVVGYKSTTQLYVDVQSKNFVQQTALTTALTTITIADAAGTPDYAIAAVTNSSAYGFSNAAEAITLLYVIKNLQTRVGELETKLKAIGILA